RIASPLHPLTTGRLRAARRVLLVENALLERVAHELRSAREAQLLHDVRAVRLRPANGDEELRRDLLIRVPEREQPQHLTLAIGERILFGPARLGGLGGDEARPERGMDVAAAARHLADRRYDLRVGGLLQDVTARPGGESLPDVLRVVLHRE